MNRKYLTFKQILKSKIRFINKIHLLRARFLRENSNSNSSSL